MQKLPQFIICTGIETKEHAPFKRKPWWLQSRYLRVRHINLSQLLLLAPTFTVCLSISNNNRWTRLVHIVLPTCVTEVMIVVCVIYSVWKLSWCVYLLTCRHIYRYKTHCSTSLCHIYSYITISFFWHLVNEKQQQISRIRLYTILEYTYQKIKVVSEDMHNVAECMMINRCICLCFVWFILQFKHLISTKS